MESKRYLIKGKVQGVYFRATIKEYALRLNVKGIVKNLPTGEVLIEAESNNLDEFEKLVKIGSKESVVEKVNFEAIDYKNYTDFEIIY